MHSVLQIVAAVTYFTEYLFGSALYLSGIALSALSAATLEIPAAAQITIQQAVMSELLIFVPAFLMTRTSQSKWIYLLCCLLIGSATGVLLAVLVQQSAMIWVLGILFVRLFLILSLNKRQDSWIDCFKIVILLAVGFALKYIALLF